MMRKFAAFAAACVAMSACSQELPRRGSLGVSFALVPDEVRAQDHLKPNEGLQANAVLPGLTGDVAGMKPGDVLVALNGKPVLVGQLLVKLRELSVGSRVRLTVFRDGKRIDLNASLLPKPNDPGNENFSVTYSDVPSGGKRMRTIISAPKSTGRHPGLMFIQGFGPTSYDYNLDSQGPDAPVLFAFANGGFVTMRVEKPGVGDSEGGPLRDLDYYQEMDVYRQALKQLRSLPDVNVSEIYIFGHSMGGAFGPMLAAEMPIEGLICYGIAARTWEEYFNDIDRYQELLAGTSYSDVDENVRETARIFNAVFQEGKSPSQVIKEHPKWKKAVTDNFPDGTFSGRTSKFWTQLENINFASYWEKCNAHVLTVWGESDFVSYRVDHELVADIVNRVHPGWGRFVTIPNSDHVMANWPTQAQSLQHFPTGPFNPAFVDIAKNWVADVRKGKA